MPSLLRRTTCALGPFSDAAVLFSLAPAPGLPARSIVPDQFSIDRGCNPAETIQPIGHHRFAYRPVIRQVADEISGKLLVPGSRFRQSSMQRTDWKQELAGNIVAEPLNPILV